jgi:NADH:ubiquinone oxidoreductase subunit 2 (subunit N)
VKVDYFSMARVALSIFWGGALCGLGYTALMSTLAAANERRSEAKDSMGMAALICIVAFLAALFFTLSIADVFHFWAWLRHR